jgi:cytoskeleton-associated protein 5
LQCLNDGTPDVRDSAFSVLAAVAKVVFPFKKNIENLFLHF